MTAYLASQQRRQCVCRSFRCTIYGWRDQNLRSDGADIDNPAALWHSTHVDNGLCHIDYTEDVHGEFIFELILLDVQESSICCSACIVY